MYKYKHGMFFPRLIRIHAFRISRQHRLRCVQRSRLFGNTHTELLMLLSVFLCFISLSVYSTAVTKRTNQQT